MRTPWRQGRRPSTASFRWPAATFFGGNEVELLRGCDSLLPAMREAIGRALHEVWIATYIFHHDDAACALCDALIDAARRGVRVRVVVDGFGSKGALDLLRKRLQGSAVALAVFRPLDRWWRLLQPSQFRRLHHKLCVVDGEVGFVGGVNIIDDRYDLNHGWTERAAARLRGARARPGGACRSSRPRARCGARVVRPRLARRGAGGRAQRRAGGATRAAAAADAAARLRPRLAAAAADPRPVRCALVVRDNLRQRRSIERSYVEAMRSARERVDLVSPYFYPGRAVPPRAARRGAARRARAAAAAGQARLPHRRHSPRRCCTTSCCADGVRIFEYTPAFLHAKVAMVDDDWATVGSSNIDPLSLLLNLEANVIVRDAAFTAESGASSTTRSACRARSTPPPRPRGFWRAAQRGFVAWCAHVYLRMAGITGRY